MELLGQRAERLILADPNAPKKPRKISDVEMKKLLEHDPAAIRRLANAK